MLISSEQMFWVTVMFSKKQSVIYDLEYFHQSPRGSENNTAYINCHEQAFLINKIP